MNVTVDFISIAVMIIQKAKNDIVRMPSDQVR